MRITQWGEYGIHCAVFLAERQRAGQLAVGAQEIADAQQIAVDYAQQILQRLRRGGVIESMRGPKGGYRLARAPEELSLFDILGAAEGSTFEVICETKPLNSDRCSDDGNCHLRPIWFDLRDHVNQFLQDRTLAALLESQQEALCMRSQRDKPVQIGTRSDTSARASD